MEPLEIEIKFYLTDIDLIRNRIIKLGANCSGRNFENNIRFEDENHTLIKNHSLLRLRKDTKTTLTFKSKPAIEENHFKILKELEVEVNDFKTMHLILESLGFHKEQVYEKWRETFVLNNSIFCIDTMPYGNFLEIESNKVDIRELSKQIGFDWEKRIIHNYLSMFDILRKNLNLSFTDLTFSNFKNIKFDFSDYLPLFEVGD
ncbi:MAG: class IV adenylate cyclase [Desulfobacterales bacterium]|nr:class IV adenylate cyclase [Desulfobacterales bacterium]